MIEAVNNYYDRCVAVKHDPYLETREKEDAFAERIVETVEKKVMSNLPALFGMYMAQMQFFPLSVPMGAYPATQGGMVYGRASANGTDNGNAVMGGAVSPIVSNPADMEAAMQNAGDVQEEAVSEYGNQVYCSLIFVDFFTSEQKCIHIFIKDRQGVAERLQNKDKGQPYKAA